jgi:tRNA dimethylallyltransferase
LEKIIIICGPTASGKTRVGIELAEKFSGEIISSDSQQIWKGFDIGTAKPTVDELSRVPHYLIDIADPKDLFDAGRFIELADGAIVDIISRGKLPIIVGGTGMYLRMLVHGMLDAPPRDDEIRAELEAEAKNTGFAELHARLAKVDPKSAERIHPNDSTRIIRALEIFELTGSSVTEMRSNHGFDELRYDALKIGLRIDRDELYPRIEARVDCMIDSGLEDEVRGLLNQYDESCQPFLAVGYREIVDYIRDRISMEEAVRLIKRNSRRFAKRQMTWFRSDSAIRWFDILTNNGAMDDLSADIAQFVDTPAGSV